MAVPITYRRSLGRIGRRSLLRGAGGAAVALPVLEIMRDGTGAALAQPAGGLPRRYVVAFAGVSLGADGDRLHNLFAPDKVGRDYDLKAGLATLAPVKNEVSVVSGLKIPWAMGGSVPPGGRPVGFHVSSLSPLLSGSRASSGTRATAPTSDQLVAAAIGGSTTFKVLAYRVQAAWYGSSSAPYGREHLSWKKDGSGNVVPAAATISPRAAYDSLFFNFVPTTGSDPAQKAHLDFLVRSRRSVLDLVAVRTERLSKRLGSADRLRLGRHFDEIRDLERRIAAMPAASTASLCAKLKDPGADPQVGSNNTASGGTNFSVTTGYSNEEERARLFCDLVHMAFTCDLSRVAALMFTMFQSHLNVFPLTDLRADLHEVGHNGDPNPRNRGTAAVSKVVAWHVKHFAYLVGKLRDTPEGAGTLLDNTALVFVNEGGHGLDPQTGNQNSAHSTENMCCLVAGRAGGLKPGQHVVAPGKHPANVLVSAMKAVGVQGETLGEVSGAIPELFA